MIAFSHLRCFPATQLDPYASILMSIVPKIEDNSVRGSAYSVVENLAIRFDDMEKKTNYFLSFVNDPNFRQRLDASVLLSKIDNRITNGIPVLTAALTNRSLVISAYPGFRFINPPGSLRHNRIIDGVQQRAHKALDRVDPELAKQYEKPEPL